LRIFIPHQYSTPLSVCMTSANFCAVFTSLKSTDMGLSFCRRQYMGLSSLTFEHQAPKTYSREMACLILFPRYNVILVENRKLLIHHTCIQRPRSAGPVRISPRRYTCGKTRIAGLPGSEKIDDNMLSRFNSIHACDRQTKKQRSDRRSDGMSIAKMSSACQVRIKVEMGKNRHC